MKASELITALQTDIDKYGNFDVRIEGKNGFGETVVWEIGSLAVMHKTIVVCTLATTGERPKAKKG